MSRVGVLVSGTGTLLHALLEADLPVVVVLADRPCAALEIASAAQVATELVDRAGFGGFGPRFDRSAYSREVADVLRAHGAEVVVMAGFGTVLDQPVHDAFGGRLLNTHPALLPAYPGWHAVADALADGAAVTGCTVHLAELEVDSGPVLAQQAVPVLAGDTEETLHERIKVVERQLYPATVRRVLEGLAAGVEPAALVDPPRGSGRPGGVAPAEVAS